MDTKGLERSQLIENEGVEILAERVGFGAALLGNFLIFLLILFFSMN